MPVRLRQNAGLAQAPGVRVALLRGINVGGKNKLPMGDLVCLFEEAGCREVRSYIQSGNVVFSAEEALARRIPSLVSAAILERFGYRVPVVMRSAAALGRIAKTNPFLPAGADPGTLHVAFLAEPPSGDRVDSLDPDRSPPDAFVLQGSEIYLHCPAGFARTRFTNAYFDSKLATTSTVRNWRTVLKLVEMVGRDAPGKGPSSP